MTILYLLKEKLRLFSLQMSEAKRARRAHPDDDFKNMQFETSEDVDVLPTFDSMNLNEDLLRGIYAYGFERPSAIQQRAIKQIVQGRDVIAQ